MNGFTRRDWREIAAMLAFLAIAGAMAALGR